MAIEWFSGAENRSIAADFTGTTNTVDAQTTQVRTGLYSWRQTGNGAHAFYKRITGTDATLTAGGAMYLGGSYQDMIFYADTSATVHVTIRINTSDQSITAYRGTPTTTSLGTTGPGLSFASSAWYYFEAKVLLSDTVGTIEVRQDGVTVLSLTGLDTKNAGTAAVLDSVGWNTPTNGNAYSNYFDDLYITSGSTGFLGDIKIEGLRPAGNGNSSQLTGSDGNSTDNYLLVDEGVQSATDYVGHATAGNKDTYALGTLGASAATIYGIKVAPTAAKSDAGAKSGRIVTRIGGADYTGADLTLPTSPTYTTFVEYQLLNPNAGTPVEWTLTDIGNLEVGWEVRD